MRMFKLFKKMYKRSQFLQIFYYNKKMKMNNFIELMIIKYLRIFTTCMQITKISKFYK